MKQWYCQSMAYQCRFIFRPSKTFHNRSKATILIFGSTFSLPEPPSRNLNRQCLPTTLIVHSSKNWRTEARISRKREKFPLLARISTLLFGWSKKCRKNSRIVKLKNGKRRESSNKIHWFFRITKRIPNWKICIFDRISSRNEFMDRWRRMLMDFVSLRFVATKWTLCTTISNTLSFSLVMAKCSFCYTLISR